MPKNPDDLKIS